MNREQTPTQCARNHPMIVIGLNKADCRSYLACDTDIPTDQINRAVFVTPGTQANYRGRIGPVFVTPGAATNPKFDELVRFASICGIICTCLREHPERVA